MRNAACLAASCFFPVKKISAAVRIGEMFVIPVFWGFYIDITPKRITDDKDYISNPANSGKYIPGAYVIRFGERAIGDSAA